MLFGTESELITCPLCNGTRKVEDKVADILMRHPWKINRLVADATREHREKNKKRPT